MTSSRPPSSAWDVEDLVAAHPGIPVGLRTGISHLRDHCRALADFGWGPAEIARLGRAFPNMDPRECVRLLGLAGDLTALGLPADGVLDWLTALYDTEAQRIHFTPLRFRINRDWEAFTGERPATFHVLVEVMCTAVPDHRLAVLAAQAGLNPPEAARQYRAGDLTEDRLRTLIALTRG